MMKIIETPFDGLFILETINFQDKRGGFQELFNYNFLQRERIRYRF